jgi:putative restriction endonuclease
LQVFLQRAASLPRTTEAERLTGQRVGQDLFCNGLLDYWDGACTVTGLAVPERLRASRILLSLVDQS